MGTKIFAAVACVALVLLVSGTAWAQTGTTTPPEGNSKHMMGFAMALGIAITAGCAALGQSNAIRGAVESVARQPEAGTRLQTMMLIGVVFIETLYIFTWVLVAFMWGGGILAH